MYNNVWHPLLGYPLGSDPSVVEDIADDIAGDIAEEGAGDIAEDIDEECAGPIGKKLGISNMHYKY